MCEFCTKHGEGKKWYLNVKNYSDELLNDVKRKKFVKDHFFWIDRAYRRYFNLLRGLPFDMPILGPAMKGLTRKIFVNKHWCQVMPIEDVAKVFDFAKSITRVPCICRKIATGQEKRLCFLISLDPKKLGIADVIDKSYFGGPDVDKFENVDGKWAVEFIRQNQREGMVTTVFAIMAPFVGIICNCDYTGGCIPMRLTNDATSFMFRAEYFATIDPDNCIGCGACLKICPFKAIKVDINTKKAEINIKECYGCGICRMVCAKKAILLSDRAQEPAVSKIW